MLIGIVMVGLPACGSNDGPATATATGEQQAPAAGAELASGAEPATAPEPAARQAIEPGSYAVTSATANGEDCDAPGEAMSPAPATVKLERHEGGIWPILTVATCEADGACTPYLAFKQPKGSTNWSFDPKYSAADGAGGCDIERLTGSIEATAAGARITRTVERVGGDLTRAGCREIGLQQSFEQHAASATCVDHQVIEAIRD